MWATMAASNCSTRNDLDSSSMSFRLFHQHFPQNVPALAGNYWTFAVFDAGFRLTGLSGNHLIRFCIYNCSCKGSCGCLNNKRVRKGSLKRIRP